MHHSGNRVLSLDPPLRPRGSGKTYGEWLREADPLSLTRAERALLKEESEWEKENLAEVKILESYIGGVYRLREAHRTLFTDIVLGGTMEDKRGPHIYPAWTKVRVFARVGSYLLGRMLDGTVLRLRREWIEESPSLTREDAGK